MLKPMYVYMVMRSLLGSCCHNMFRVCPVCEVFCVCLFGTRITYLLMSFSSLSHLNEHEVTMIWNFRAAWSWAFLNCLLSGHSSQGIHTIKFGSFEEGRVFKCSSRDCFCGFWISRRSRMFSLIWLSCSTISISVPLLFWYLKIFLFSLVCFSIFLFFLFFLLGELRFEFVVFMSLGN